ncbi:DUF4144 domain-containing protein [Pseudoalteromonas sp. ACER1]|uniref:hypothetical protein n=1 Tax=Pseudoalteromonas TaxID=53246 RepID=UPI00188800A9|nr:MULTISPECIES: hypothetical protein [unclassified Pseudoalteromonas]MCF2846004.1 DUF4144 domain-containing protein [Pseudoalteromonas sp. PAST1]MCO7209387.1 DUF4144 domain-containing protein [Pseudoalteromonas sp. ACER1]
MHSSFPKIIFSDHELALVEDEADIESFVYGLSEEQQETILLLTTGQYVNLQGESVKALTDVELANRVTEYLAQEGVCCLSKVTRLTPPQAFAMLVD